jgi:homoserine O-succinyltransferase/O-acetyltransferase
MPDSALIPTERQLFDLLDAAVFRNGAIKNRSPELFASFPTDRLAKDVRNVWQSPARRIYRNWLLYLEAQRVERSKPVYAL